MQGELRGLVAVVLGVTYAFANSALGNADLVIASTDVTVAQNQQNNTTTVTVVVHNRGDAACGPFDLRVGVSGTNTSAWGDHRIIGIAAGAATTRVVTVDGLSWKCGWASADVRNEINENNESNNSYSQNKIWIVIPSGRTIEDMIGVVNPQLTPELVILETVAPPGWDIRLDPQYAVIDPGQTLPVRVTYTAPPESYRHQPIVLTALFADGSPGAWTWDVHAFSLPQALDTVVCETLGGGDKDHPPVYWYDVTPAEAGRCDFHVKVFDAHPANYTDPTLPAPTWRFAVHQVGTDWYASWWDPQCENAIFDTFRFQFRNPHESAWSHWTTTIGADSDPFAQVVDTSAAHDLQSDGGGFRVHVPGACTGREKISRSACELRQGANRLVVKLVRGVPGDFYRIDAGDGFENEGILNARGKATAKFNGLPSGNGEVQAMWGCGKEESAAFTCP
ncbi:MAG: hypothetical protein KJ057_16900 [Phycisphaerae bacterium]|nr:hypothetical protein [Planctomycetia bacterium]MCK6466426.1 hypothetical protein [Phycisphaerae bacterium]MCL4720144.1 hypothetical protein [Phycisphaerae bacterium]NUQ10532.1 hypothetical protein [Phycisphaerae bacterium]